MGMSKPDHTKNSGIQKNHNHPFCKNENRKQSAFLLFIGLISLAWFLIRTGTKPTRALYPCQQTALANSIAFVPGLTTVFLAGNNINKKLNKSWKLGFMIVFLILTLIIIFSNEYARQSSWAQMVPNQPLGVPAGVSPGRVVWTHDADATTGNYSQYWTQIDQAKVDNMMEMSLKALAGAESGSAAIAKLFPCGANCTGKKIAIKVNFNNSGRGDDQMDSNSQTVNALLKYLTSAGQGGFQPFNQADIYIYDASRKIRSTFINQVKSSFPNVLLYSKSDIVNSSENYTFDPNYCQPSAAHKVPEIIKNADYLIDIPILKAHGNAGVTLTFKNHFGSATDPVSFHPCIDRDMKFLVGMYTAGFHNADNSPTTIAQKTKLIVGDALYGNFHGPNNPPENWSVFKNDSPNSLFLSQDPVAIDTVMFDLIMQQIGSFNSAKQQYLEEAASRASGSLGVHEHPGPDQGCSDLKDLGCWKFTKLDYVICDISGNRLNALCKGTETVTPVNPTPTILVPTFACMGGVNCVPSITPTPVISGQVVIPTNTQNTTPTLVPSIVPIATGNVPQSTAVPTGNGNQVTPQMSPVAPTDKIGGGQEIKTDKNNLGFISIILQIIQLILELLKSLLAKL